MAFIDSLWYIFPYNIYHYGGLVHILIISDSDKPYVSVSNV